MAGSASEDSGDGEGHGRVTGVLSRMLSMAAPSHVCGSKEMPLLARFAMATREFLRERAQRLLRRSSGSALLYWYSNDTTPMVTRRTFHTVVGAHSTWHRARQSCEYVIQRLFLQDSNGQSAAVLVEPQRVTDKTAETHFEMSRHILEYPRSLMTDGILVECNVWDGALFSACDRLHRQHISAYHNKLRSEVGDGEAALSELTHWYTSAKCVLHLAHGGLRRGVLSFFSDPQCLKNCWVVLEALRSSYGQLVANSAAWVQRRLFFEDWVDMEHPEELWRALVRI